MSVEWFDQMIAEMIEDGLVEEVEPGVVQKIGGHGYMLDYTQFQTQIGDLPKEAQKEFKIALLAIMEAPEIMGTPFEL